MPPKRRPRHPANSSNQTACLPRCLKWTIYSVLVLGVLSPLFLWAFLRQANSGGLDPRGFHHDSHANHNSGGLATLKSPSTNGGGGGAAAVAPASQPAAGGLRSTAGKGDPSLPGLSILILCKDELKSLQASLETWDKGGVLGYADEVIVYFQGRNQRKDDFLKPWTSSGKITKIIGNRRNYPIGAAVNWLVGNATQPLVLFLEKDFQLIEPSKFVAPRLDDGKRLMATGEADVVRYRSRWNSGNPNYAMGMFQGREHVILQRQPNLYCSVHYWLTNEQLDQKPHTRYIWRCPNSREYYCTKAKFCNWTNNPQMFFADWFLKRYSDHINRIIKLTYPQSDLEYFMNWEYEVWNNADITVAMGEGLFIHKEIGEHREVDYAALRKAEEDGDIYEDCDLGRRFNEQQCKEHKCTWQPGHPTATCFRERGHLAPCEIHPETAAVCTTQPGCFWNDWVVWLPAKCLKDV